MAKINFLSENGHKRKTPAKWPGLYHMLTKELLLYIDFFYGPEKT
jgi:hypothetical protein